MRKTSVLLLSLLLFIILLISCGNNSESNLDTENTTNTESNENESIDTDDKKDPEIEYTPSGYIYTAEELAKISPTGEYVLANDIDLNGEKWTPIDFGEDVYFSGVLDGNGFSIKNAVIEYDKCTGIIVTNSGTIKNLGVENINALLTTTGDPHHPCIGAIVAHNKGVIKNCFSTGKIKVVSNGDTFDRIGGLVGTSYKSVINCYSSVDIDAYANSSNSVGGLIGDATGIVVNSYSIGNLIVKVNENTHMGGLVGFSNADIINCYSTGSIDVALDALEPGVFVEAFAGGIAGEANYGNIINCFSTSTIKSTNARTGEIIGGSNYNMPASVKNCYYATEETSNEESTFENLHSKEWMLENLWKVDEEAWTWEDGKLPILNFEYLFLEPVVEISSERDLRKLQGKTLSLNYKIVNDIYLSGEFEPILANIAFFNGNGKSISNLKNSKEKTGLVLYNAGTLENLHIKNVDITLTKDNSYGNEDIGIVNLNSGDIIGCSAEGEISSTELTDAHLIAGLVGRNEGNVLKCSTNVQINVKTTNSIMFGGVVGWNYRGNIEYSYAVGDVVGTIEGIDQSLQPAPLSRMGGIVAYLDAGSIINCYSSCEMKTIIKSERAFTMGCMGGIAGEAIYGTMDTKIENCLSMGDLYFTVDDPKFTMQIGSIAGSAWNDLVMNNCYRLDKQEIYAATEKVQFCKNEQLVSKEELNTIKFFYEKLSWHDLEFEFIDVK